jgi:hypothetical protein
LTQDRVTRPLAQTQKATQAAALRIKNEAIADTSRDRDATACKSPVRPKV